MNLPLITIRPVSPNDNKDLCAIYNHYVLESTATCDLYPRTLDEQVRWTTQHSADPYPAWVALIDGRVVGYASLSPFNPKPAYRQSAENSVYVHHNHIKKGIGRMLLLHLIDQAPLHGITNIVALITEGNDVSITLHEQNAFRLCGRIENVATKAGKSLTLIIMQLSLPLEH